jgi:hypothetical protein
VSCTNCAKIRRAYVHKLIAVAVGMELDQLVVSITGDGQIVVAGGPGAPFDTRRTP